MNGNPFPIIARAPTRIDLGGGWTDVPPYSDEQGGFVCNIAINLYAVARVAAAALPVAGAPRAANESALAMAALRRANTDASAQPVQLSLESNFPIGAGLGGSSAAGVAALGALRAWRGESLDRAQLAELSRSVEVEDLGIAGGRQDHYAAAFGGALGLQFGRGEVQVQKIALPSTVTTAIEQRAVLVYTGESRISGDTISSVLHGYAAREPRVCNALHSMRSLAVDIAAALTSGDVDSVASLVGAHWQQQRSLHTGISTQRIDRIMEVAATNGAQGGKALGASGGGCVLLFSAPGERERLTTALHGLGDILDFRIDTHGLVVTHDVAGDTAHSDA